ncbi:MAG: OmpA family protein [Maribacter dokdonensis]|uniref:Outer membrane protein OmpA n=2 Tax=Flavobacteriaceae TaxID=49546 RepID=A0A1H4SS21_9FLAO|nr:MULTISPECIES: OmpA family protein [Maribacter]HAF76802.1 OmpA family protein [Maribacter sp.]APA66072.1 membrane protein [Maribacter sp. 1_2014MBL_MicDiv]KSA13872.1 OmpA family protein [Maribacter dokdonensis DSW-8]MBU2902582.1 OmpA family protein [Maribacter dokdonensis]MDP2524588.1 OmpA family protein [Maribacter dokdonensis]|tara:strand:+ start:514 stop:1206 length:693 start_codon:yes stop_codon:yes gene_type:complete
MKTMILRKTSYIIALAMVMSCSTVKNANKTQKGAVIGATGGAVIGGVLGNNVGSGNNTALGAILGAAIGGAAGGYIGNRMDRQAERIEEEIPGAEVKRVGEGINVTFNEDAGVYFDTNKSNVQGTSATTLNKLVGIFKEYPKSNILVEGHTDSAGAEEYNLNLSKQRAESVTNYLISQGIDASRFDTKWYGETQPVGDNSTAAGKAKNRRVELAIVASESLKQEAKTQTN